jgi:hypothetical protein
MIKIRDSPKSAPSKSRSVPLNPETAPLSWHSIQISISILEIYFPAAPLKYCPFLPKKSCSILSRFAPFKPFGAKNHDF